MKITTGLISLVALLGGETVALAVATASGDGSQLAVNIFLGMCALIVVVQLFPLFFILYGLVKGLVQGRKETAVVAEEVVSDK